MRLPTILAANLFSLISYAQGYEKMIPHYNSIASGAVNLNDEGFGMGVAYEHLLGGNGYFGVYLPVNYVFTSFNTKYGSRPRRNIFEFLPGIKFYPGARKGKFTYAIGPQFIFAYGTRGQENAYGSIRGRNYYSPDVSVPVRRFGVLLTNYLHFPVSPKLFIGADLGLGVTYYNRAGSLGTWVTGYLQNDGARALAQFNVRVGYKF